MLLSGHTKFKFDDCYAKLILEICYDKFKNNISIKDKPDLRSPKNNIGIEVTNIMGQGKKESLTLWYKNPSVSESNQKRNITRMEQLGVTFENGVPRFPIIKYDKGLDSKPYLELYKAIKNKIQKLNSGYEIFKSNELFIFSDLFLAPFDEIRLVDRIKDSMSEGKIKFDVIYILAFDKLLCYDFNKNTCEQKYVLNQKAIAIKARKMAESEETNE